MDVQYFSKHRTDFIRRYYREASKPFIETRKAIDEEREPYNEPPPHFDIESGEPAYLEEWLEADMALNVVGYSCLSMLSNSLKITFANFQQEFGFRPTDKEKRKLFKKGFVPAYKVMLGEVLDTDWSDCPADFAIIEQVVLVRNITQHMNDYSGFDAFYDEESIRSHRRLYFVGGDTTEHDPEDPVSWFGRRVEVSADDLFLALDHVDMLVDYIQSREEKAYEWRVRRRNERDA
ncbi:hypothetical protein ABID08_002345 [Rhizobium binae]|uniref:HEPN/Toprim N-terminal domain-containing protein n=1 Tax=Rhizobium binae TaxID=1138190 RepID=A0ABV2MEU0_9HYPH|nr:hypothetical protein [Rhizobium binae]MBX4993161.1 hypothetical protein [Rhizobium binae]NKL47464.1 hypothetical protein [Rhizobium leguminosarum bv. viciae]QSY83917.1 hypothetical protein J2J99_09040 [Rhizobium binae]